MSDRLSFFQTGNIECVYSRLVKKIRLRDGSTSNNTGLLTRDWDIDIEEREAEFKDDLRAASGIGRRKRKVGINRLCNKKRFIDISTVQKGRVAGPILSQQVKSLIGDGNQAYVDNDLAEAIRIMQEVIRIEPRATAAWSVLAQCYEDMNESQKALQLRIMAAHLRHDAEEWDRLARESKYASLRQNILRFS